MFDQRFAGQRAIITGGASGIGREVARRLIAEGARVVLWDRDRTQIDIAEADLGPGAKGFAVDVADAAGVEVARDDTLQHLGGIDVLVAAAGITGPNTSLWNYPVEEWRRVIDINLNGVFLCDRAVVPAMMASGYGRIVNIASVAGKEGNPNASAYSASKAAVIGMTKSLGKELAKTGITVNCVTPAAVRTGIFDQMSQEHIDFMLSKIPMGRFGAIEEIVALIAWIASKECSFTTGAVFDASGGRATY